MMVKCYALELNTPKCFGCMMMRRYLSFSIQHHTLSYGTHNYNNTQLYFERAIACSPNNASIWGHYAWYLHTAGKNKDIDKAETMYKQALDINPTHIRHLGDYACFLYTRRNDVEG